MPSRVWQPADALAFRCSVEEVGTLAPVAAEVLDRAPMALPNPDELRQRALLALLRLAEEGTGFAAVAAAKELLSRLPPVAVASGSLAPWLTGRRYMPPADGLPELREAAGLNQVDLGIQ